MGNGKKTYINEKFKQEYRWFIENYLFRLLGITKKQLKNDILELDTNPAFVVRTEGAVYFSASRWRLFRLDLEGAQGLTEDNIRLANRIIQEFISISEYKRTGNRKQNNAYPDIKSQPGSYTVYRDYMYKRAIEKGICYWMLGDYQSDYIEEFLGLLGEWAVKTYEGRTVTMGFIINPSETSVFDDTYGNWLSFMKDDSVAVLTDCIHSVIELDKDCNYLRHISISDGDCLHHCNLSYKIPIRFTQIIQTHVKDGKVGVFLLNNGDIILAKGGAICFVKRNLQWLNLSYEAFCNSLEPFIKEYHISNTKLIESIFASVLDVSFSHTGGIIALVDTPWKNRKAASLPESGILNLCDNLQTLKTSTEIFNEIIKGVPKGILKGKIDDANKRLLKRNVIQSLVYKDKFQDIDRKLRCELISLDGACIVDREGKVYSFGAIIQNDSGSSGGGRGAAARKLSAYGMAVKISTDGYIELYIDETVEYAIK